jgi:hypothetical protein
MSPQERVLYLNDSELAVGGMEHVFESKGTGEGYDHSFVGSATSVEGLKEVLGSGVEPTVLLMDPLCPTEEDGRLAVEFFRTGFPSARVVTISLTGKQSELGDENLVAPVEADDLMSTIAALKHE